MDVVESGAVADLSGDITFGKYAEGFGTPRDKLTALLIELPKLASSLSADKNKQSPPAASETKGVFREIFISASFKLKNRGSVIWEDVIEHNHSDEAVTQKNDEAAALRDLVNQDEFFDSALNKIADEIVSAISPGQAEQEFELVPECTPDGESQVDINLANGAKYYSKDLFNHAEDL